MTIPTALTFARIALVPVFVLSFYLPFTWSNEVVVALFVIAALSDALDGILARKLEQVSAFGAFLDPTADKLLVVCALVLIVGAHPSALVVLPAIVIIGREMTVSALREWMAEIGLRNAVKVSRIGKIKTIVQCTAIAFLLYQEPLGQLSTFFIGIVLLYVATVLTLWSMTAYLLAAWDARHTTTTY